MRARPQLIAATVFAALTACSAPLVYFPYYVENPKVLVTQSAKVCVHDVKATDDFRREHPERLERVRVLIVSYLRRHDVTVMAAPDHEQCDVFVHPAIYPRQAELAGRSARWDGVERRIPTESSSASASTLDLDGFGPAISLRIQVVDEDGEVVFRSMGGIEVSEVMTWSAPKETWAWAPRDDLLTDERALRRAIPLALHPLIVAKDYPDRPVFYEPGLPAY